MPTPSNPEQPTRQDRLLANEGLLVGQSISTLDSNYSLTLQTDSNLVLTAPQGAIWSAEITYERNAFDAVMQSDGNFVVRDINNNTLWASGTSLFPGAMLVIVDGGFVIFNAQNRSLITVGQITPTVTLIRTTTIFTTATSRSSVTSMVRTASEIMF
jgi:hypothetical protein